MDFNPPTTGELAYSDAQEARRENAMLRGRLAALEAALVRVAHLLSKHGLASPGEVREALTGSARP